MICPKCEKKFQNEKGMGQILEKNEVLFEDDTMKIYVIPNLLQIVIQCKDKGSYETYKSIMAMLPSLQTMLKATLETKVGLKSE